MTYPREYNAARDFIERNLTAGRGEQVAFRDPRHSLTYGGLERESARLANLLRAEGLVQEDRVALLVLDGVDFPVIFWGAIRAGVVPVALNTMLTSEQVRYVLEDSRAKGLFLSAPLLESLRPALADLPHLRRIFLLDGEEEPGMTAYHPALAAQPQSFAPVRTCCDEVAFWLYSSGSTGSPKGVPHVHKALMETARLYGEGILQLSENDVVFSAAKLFFAYGLGNAMSFPMAVGAQTLLWPARPTPADVFRVLEEGEVTVFYGVPTLYAAMLAHLERTPGLVALPKLRLCVSAGEALPAEIGRAWQSRFGVDIIDGVGSTEMLHIFLSNRPGDVVYGTSGRAVPGYDLRLVGEDGRPVDDTDEVGELLVRGSSAAAGYWNQRDKSRRTFEGEWTHTGDKYTVDEEGRYHYCGRTDDMFKVSGQWVSPFEVEQALIAHESVLEAAVVAYEDDQGLTKPRAFIVLKAGAPDDALRSSLQTHVKDRIGRSKYPRQIAFVDSLPKTATGKIQRFKLRDG